VRQQRVDKTWCAARGADEVLTFCFEARERLVQRGAGDAVL
jgi:hypothetical protein